MRAATTICLLGAALALVRAQPGTLASFPDPGTGGLNCIAPIRQLNCTVDNRSGFVAGIGFGAGITFRTGRPFGRQECSSGLQTWPNTGVLDQTTWSMWDTSSPTFPKLANGSANLNYYFPFGGLITQMIVLKAENPYGEGFGSIPAIIFRYTMPPPKPSPAAAPGEGGAAQLQPGAGGAPAAAEQQQQPAGALAGAAANGTKVVGGSGAVPAGNLTYANAICGNALYAKFYLDALNQRPPPTPVELLATYVNPLPDRVAFLSSFVGKCSAKGLGYLGGDPNTSSKYHLKALTDVCFSPLYPTLPFFGDLRPVRPPEPQYNWDVPHTPCSWDPKTGKGEIPTSAECARGGAQLLTGKWGAILVDREGRQLQPARDEATGRVVAAPFSGEAYLGSEPGRPITR